ncbi:MAG TPA: helix-turn-helix transcriptional regulator [Candidatus Avipropionibacterium avicola]|uniref:Helix-turn-helix transcriptional regulator n=1 Tax=Candidatus Avipropionibacterium avicola TaxID=2840701 RepID=A0A9D1H2W9_9ACTN|nr:helix-turn-helix transcriptional regulator [Candidatus Avipropionibacterium avicola]
MASTENPALERLFDTVDVRIHRTRSVIHDDAALVTLGRVPTLIFVVDGELRDDTRGVRLTPGSAFLGLGRGPMAFESSAGTRLMQSEIELAAGPLRDALPDWLSVGDFATVEASAAALAATLGHDDPAVACTLRSGDPVICRMMVTTVLLSVIRAWSGSACAPDGWPTPAADPFLARVIEAVHAEPGRDWTVELLATLGAMSRSVFSERFRLAVGSSPATYVTAVRMDTAKSLLRAGRTVSDTARELGYSSDEGFSRAFRRHTGRTPSSWRVATAA